jgi:cobalamin biosynthesis protein CobT
MSVACDGGRTGLVSINKLCGQYQQDMTGLGIDQWSSEGAAQQWCASREESSTGNNGTDKNDNTNGGTDKNDNTNGGKDDKDNTNGSDKDNNNGSSTDKDDKDNTNGGKNDKDNTNGSDKTDNRPAREWDAVVDDDFCTTYYSKQVCIQSSTGMVPDVQAVCQAN